MVWDTPSHMTVGTRFDLSSGCQKRKIKTIIGAFFFCLILLWIRAADLPRRTVNDSVEYWASAHLLRAHHNPYDADSVLELEKQAGRPGESPLVMWNPPWVLPLLLPFALFSYPTAQYLWLLAGCLCMFASLHKLWQLYGKSKYPPPIACLLISVFTPLLLVLVLGQITPLMTLGIAGFLDCQRKQKYGRAGIYIFLIALKPHLAFLFWAAFILWVLSERKWRALWFFLATIAAFTGIAIVFDRQVLNHYREFWIHHSIAWNEFPTIPGLLCKLAGVQSIALPALPAGLAVLGFLVHWVRVRKQWNWQNELPILLLVSLSTSPYAWLFDGVILLPALLRVTNQPLPSSRPTWFLPLLFYFLINLSIVILVGIGKTLFWYAWVNPIWLLLYLWVRRLDLARFKLPA